MRYIVAGVGILLSTLCLKVYYLDMEIDALLDIGAATAVFMNNQDKLDDYLIKHIKGDI